MSWSKDLFNFNRELIDGHREFVRDLAVRVYGGVTFRSPVATGRFRGSWTISWDSPDTAVLADGGGVVPFTPQGLPAPPGDFPVAFINNSLPYGPRLEDGWSAQAPIGMVAVTLADLEALF